MHNWGECCLRMSSWHSNFSLMYIANDVQSCPGWKLGQPLSFLWPSGRPAKSMHRAETRVQCSGVRHLQRIWVSGQGADRVIIKGPGKKKEDDVTVCRTTNSGKNS